MATILILNIASLAIVFTAFSGVAPRRARRAWRGHRVLLLGRTAPRR